MQQNWIMPSFNTDYDYLIVENSGLVKTVFFIKKSFNKIVAVVFESAFSEFYLNFKSLIINFTKQKLRCTSIFFSVEETDNSILFQ